MKRWNAALLLSLLLLAGGARAAERPVLVELFTSEGCSSCPPADALLAELAARPGILALSYHVDYWDRLGWKDPYSSPQATQRQQEYARLLGLDSVYTPQIVVDGRWQAVGSERSAIERALTAAAAAPAHGSLTLTIAGGEAQVALGDARVPGSVVLVGFDRRHSDAVLRGENAGQTLTHADVVRGIVKIGRSAEVKPLLRVPVPWPAERYAALLHAADGQIIAVAVADNPAAR